MTRPAKNVVLRRLAVLVVVVAVVVALVVAFVARERCEARCYLSSTLGIRDLAGLRDAVAPFWLGDDFAWVASRYWPVDAHEYSEILRIAGLDAEYSELCESRCDVCGGTLYPPRDGKADGVVLLWTCEDGSRPWLATP
jgi:hypothetical protein